MLGEELPYTYSNWLNYLCIVPSLAEFIIELYNIYKVRGKFLNKGLEQLR